MMVGGNSPSFNFSVLARMAGSRFLVSEESVSQSTKDEG